MNKISISPARFSLFLISSTFLAMWITGFISTFGISSRAYLLLLYLFSLFLPAAGLLIFMQNTKKDSARWYWGIPLLISLFPITFLRDSMIMPFLYDISFISAFDRWEILESTPVRDFISIFFSLASGLFCLSIPEEKRNKMMLSFKLSLAAAFVIVIFFIDYLIRGNLANADLFGLHVMVIFFLGLSFVRVAINYDRE